MFFYYTFCYWLFLFTEYSYRACPSHSGGYDIGCPHCHHHNSSPPGHFPPGPPGSHYAPPPGPPSSMYPIPPSYPSTYPAPSPGFPPSAPPPLQPGYPSPYSSYRKSVLVVNIIILTVLMT